MWPTKLSDLNPPLHTSRLTGNFVQIRGSKFCALGGLNQKSKKTVLQNASWRTDGQKWLDSIDKQSRRSNLKGRDRQTDRVVDNNDSQLGAEIRNSISKREEPASQLTRASICAVSDRLQILLSTRWTAAHGWTSDIVSHQCLAYTFCQSSSVYPFTPRTQHIRPQ